MKEREKKGGSKGCFVVVVVAVLVRALVYANVDTVSFLMRKLVLVLVFVGATVAFAALALLAPLGV